MIKQTTCHLSQGNFSPFSKNAWLSLQAGDGSAALPSLRGCPMRHRNMRLCQGTHGAVGDIQGPASYGQTHLLKQVLINNRIYDTFQDLPETQHQTTSCMPCYIHIFKSAKEKHKKKFMTRLQSVLLKLLLKTTFEGLESRLTTGEAQHPFAGSPVTGATANAPNSISVASTPSLPSSQVVPLIFKAANCA